MWRFDHVDSTRVPPPTPCFRGRRQQPLVLESGKIRKEKDAQINAINSQLVNSIAELRKRPSRTEQANNGQSGTGMSLSAEDASFLVWEAARADRLRTELESCYKQYDSIK